LDIIDRPKELKENELIPKAVSPKEETTKSGGKEKKKGK